MAGHRAAATVAVLALFALSGLTDALEGTLLVTNGKGTFAQKYMRHPPPRRHNPPPRKISPKPSPVMSPSPEMSPSPSDMSPSPSMSFDTVLDFLASRPDLSLAYSNIQNIPALAGPASDPNAVATFFCPTDTGFLQFIADVNVTLDMANAGSLEVLGQVFMYHTIPGAAVYSYDLPDGTIETATALPGFNLTITKTADGVVVKAIFTTARVVEANINGGKTVIHIIDYPLIPFPFGNMTLPPPPMVMESPSPMESPSSSPMESPSPSPMESPSPEDMMSPPGEMMSPPESPDSPQTPGDVMSPPMEMEPPSSPSAPAATVRALLSRSLDTLGLVSLVGMAGPLGREANDKDAVFTLFAPSSMAFSNAYMDWDVGMRFGMYSVALMDVWYQDMAIMSSDLKDGDKLTVGMNPDLPGSYLAVKIKGNDVMIEGYSAANTAKVTKADMMAGKAVVHMVDKWPISMRTASVFGLDGTTPLADADRSVLEAMVVDADVFQTMYYLFLSSFFSRVTDPAWKGTLFAPNKRAWSRMTAAAPHLNLNMSDPAAGNVTKFIDEILEQHILAGKAVASADITSGMTVGLGVAGGYSHTFTITDGKVYLSTAQGTEAEVVKADMMAGAAMIHIVDRIIITDAIATKYMLNMTAPEAPPSPGGMPSPSPTPSPTGPTYKDLDAALASRSDLGMTAGIVDYVMENPLAGALLSGFLGLGYDFFAPTDAAWNAYWASKDYTLDDLQTKLENMYDSTAIMSVVYPHFILLGAKDLAANLGKKVATGMAGTATASLMVSPAGDMYSLTTTSGVSVNVVGSGMIEGSGFGGPNYFYVVDRVIECDDCSIDARR